ncbi:MAG: helix-turn-helix domain-containing protein [Lachnospiraceae bacterium]|nr:helix-turn-helix domain-containing protein [Lachnospiraceae bacterium]
MEVITVGSLIKEIRTAKKVTRKKLSYGVCSEHVLRELEEDCYTADVLMLDIFLQRLGQSPDKFEMVLSSKLFNMVRLRDLIAEAIYRGKRELAELLLQNYPSRTHVDEMYQYRMKAFAAYHIDKNCALAAEHLRKAAALTLPEYSYECFYEQMENHLISAAELENLLALERMNLEGSVEDSTIRKIAKHHLELCMGYIEKHFSGDEEYAKLISKCTWLLGGIFYVEKDYVQAMVFCKKGIEELRKNTILYFMLPLLELMVKSETALGIAPERSKWVQYYNILTFLWKGYAPKWYPADSLFHNCYQRDYHLDYELIRSERKSQNMTQAQLAEDIYQNPESLSRMETGNVSPNKKTFEKLMDKLGLEKRIYNGCVVTNSFEVMELKRSIDGFMMRRDFIQAKEATKKLKNNLDMTISENKMVVQLYEIVTAKRLGEMTAEEALEELKNLSERFMNTDQNTFSHIPMRNEVLVINNICITLCELGNVADAIELCRIALVKIKSSKEL